MDGSTTYYVEFDAEPAPGSEHAGTIKDAKTHVWVVDDDASAVLHRAKTYLLKHGWIVVRVVEGPRPTTFEQQRDLGRDIQWGLAQRFGISVALVPQP